ncbi:uncharacterized protein LOC111080087 [Drosophila obscura]|uniref:uncharacterized protein LOC111080087 n=1 Tax=Drosophila obscura TaxID=7282 RepID=UPI001BB2689A|nr:uncharacterized protein LOC111080087 [Drosophila obscura]
MEARNLVSYLKEFCVKLKLNAPIFEIEAEPNREFRCKLELQGIKGCATGRSKQCASHVAARNVWAQIMLHPAVRAIIQQKDCLPYIQKGDIFWEVRLLKIKQVKGLRELLILVASSESIGNGSDMPQSSILEVATTTEVRMGNRVLENVPIVEVPGKSFLEKLALPVLLVRGGLEETPLTEVIVSSVGKQASKSTSTEVQCLGSVLEVLRIAEGPESSPVEVAHSPVLPEVSSQKSQDSEEEQISVSEEEVVPVPVPIPDIPVSRVIEKATPASVATDIPDIEDEFEKQRMFETFRKIIKTYEHKTKTVPICERHNYFKKLPQELKAEGFKVINSNDFKTVREKAITLLYALKLPHTISKMPSISGVPMVKVELDCSYEGIFLDFESNIYHYIIDFMRNMLV